METVPGYRATSWAAGYGDYVMKPDLATLRRVPWLEGTALVLCDVLDHHGHGEVPHAPRAVLKRQIARLRELGLPGDGGLGAGVLPLLQLLRRAARRRATAALSPVSPYNEDYHIFQTTKEEDVMRAIRTGLNAAGIPVENSKGEASAGQEEINVRYGEVLTAADAHAIVKNAVKEIAWSKGKAVTFMAKYDARAAGSSSHLHLSLSDARRQARLLRSGRALRHVEADAELRGGAPRARQRRDAVPGALRQQLQALLGRDLRADQGGLVGGQPHRRLPPGRRGHARRSGSNAGWAGPTSTRTSPMRRRSPPGSTGSSAGWSSRPEFRGDAYAAARVREIPKTLRDAIEALRRSKMLRAALGDEVVEHYLHAARWEQAQADRAVTDWEVARGFERA